MNANLGFVQCWWFHLYLCKLSITPHVHVGRGQAPATIMSLCQGVVPLLVQDGDGFLGLLMNQNKLFTQLVNSTLTGYKKNHQNKRIFTFSVCAWWTFSDSDSLQIPPPTPLVINQRLIYHRLRESQTVPISLQILIYILINPWQRDSKRFEETWPSTTKSPDHCRGLMCLRGSHLERHGSGDIVSKVDFADEDEL